MGVKKLCPHGVLGVKSCNQCCRAIQAKYRRSPKGKLTSLRSKPKQRQYLRLVHTKTTEYLKAVSCPICLKRGGLRKLTYHNKNSGKSWTSYRVSHQVWNRGLYKKLRAQGMSRAQAFKQRGVRTARSHKISKPQVIALLGYLP